MDQVVADDRQRHRQQREHQHRRRRRHAVQRVQGLRREDLIEGVESDVGDQRHAPHQQCAHVAELRPRLDHLRQSELRALGRMKRHEERAEGRAEHHRDRHPNEIAAERDADHAGRHRRQVRIARKTTPATDATPCRDARRSARSRSIASRSNRRRIVLASALTLEVGAQNTNTGVPPAARNLGAARLNIRTDRRARCCCRDHFPA